MSGQNYLLSLVLLLSLMVSTTGFAHGDKHAKDLSSQATKSGIKGICNGDPVSYITAQHPDLLTHKRDKVLRQGAKNNTKYSLQGCVNCHASKKADNSNTYHAIDEEGQFCSTCHKQVATSVDCFQCHRTTPYEGKTYYKKDHLGLKDNLGLKK